MLVLDSVVCKRHVIVIGNCEKRFMYCTLVQTQLL